MEPWQSTLLNAYGVIVFIVICNHLVYAIETGRITFLTPESPKLEGESLPFVSILVPAKDEQATIEGCIHSLLAQEYPNFEVLIVDDRSEDDTAAIVERMASEDDRLRLVQVEKLPDGWTGKTHALQVCQEHARGEWLLFVDADTLQHPTCLSVVMQDCISHEVGMETLLPALEVRSFWEGVVQPFAGTLLMLLYPLRKLNDPGPKGKAWGNGQFILMSRAAYDTIGRHEAVRDKFVEDIHLGRLIRKYGLGLRVASGAGVSKVRMYASLTDIVRGWSRILYSAVDFRPAKLYGLFAATCAFSVLSYVVLITSGTAWLTGNTSSFVSIAFLMAVVHEIAQLTLHARIYARSHSAMKYLPFRICGVFVVLYLLAKTIRMCSTHKVIWRGTSYGQDIQQSS